MPIRQLALVLTVASVGCAAGPYIMYDQYAGTCAMSDFAGPGPLVVETFHGSDAVKLSWTPGPIAGRPTFQCMKGDERFEFKSGEEGGTYYFSKRTGLFKAGGSMAAYGTLKDFARLAEPGWMCRYYTHEGPLPENDRLQIAKFVAMVSGPVPAKCGGPAK